MSNVTTDTADEEDAQQSISVAAARNLATTTKTVPMTIGVTPRWFLSFLPWVGVEAGTYRVNRRKLVSPERSANEFGEHEIELEAGHEEETSLPSTFVDYEEDPREYSLSVVQTVLRINTRVTDIYNSPHNQLRQQVRLTMQAMKERQEWELINHPEFGLLQQAAPSMRIQSRNGSPTPDDMDELLSLVWKQPAFFLAHPRAIAAFGRECTRRGVPPPTVQMSGSPFLTWRGVPLVPCDKLAVDGRRRADTASGTTSVALLRVGEAQQGVVGLHQPELADGIEGVASTSMRFMGINQKAIASYLMTLYFSLAVLTDDAVGILENVEVGNYHTYD